MMRLRFLSLLSLIGCFALSPIRGAVTCTLPPTPWLHTAVMLEGLDFCFPFGYSKLSDYRDNPESLALGVYAQPLSKPVLSETSARLYLQYFNDDFAFGLDYAALKSAYKSLKRFEDYNLVHFLLGKHLNNVNVVGASAVAWQWPYIFDSCMIVVYQQLQDANVTSSRKVRERLKRQIADFRAQSSALPTFYQIIDNDFKGDISAYVDDLFDHTLFKNWTSLRVFFEAPSCKRIREDPLVLFDLSRMQFMARIQQEQPNVLKKEQ